MTGSAEQWHHLARQTRRKINCGWWLHACGTPLVVVSLLLLGPALWARQMWPAEALLWLGWLAGTAAALVVIGSWWRARRRFVDCRGALVRLEERLGLHNALSSAAVGACAWPPMPARADAGLRWSFANTLVPPLTAAAFLAAAWWVPVKARLLPSPPDEPAAWAAIEENLSELAQQQAADPESLEEIEQRVAELRAQQTAKWFSHASLEATDQLREAHLRAMADLQRQLTRTRESASRLAGDPAQLPAQTRAGLQDQFKQALQAMQAGALKPNKELLEKLRQIDPSRFGELDPAQLEQLLADLAEKAEALAQCLGCQPGEPDEEALGLLAAGADGAGPGTGGVTRGPGTSPDLFGENRSELEAQKPQLLDNPDLSRALPGDLLETSNSQHDVDATRPPVQSGGKAAIQGGGGSAWQESLHPREQDALKKFFE